MQYRIPRKFTFCELSLFHTVSLDYSINELLVIIAMKYKVIKSKTQYKEYAKIMEGLASSDLKSKEIRDEIELLTLLIEKWDEENNSFDDVDAITILHSLMEERNLKAKDLVEILGVSKGLVSDILNYKKGISNEIIRSLSDYFKVSQEAFNRPYELEAN
jgi:HTH-type transcriptional regulator/antitoxin HigA